MDTTPPAVAAPSAPLLSSERRLVISLALAIAIVLMSAGAALAHGNGHHHGRHGPPGVNGTVTAVSSPTFAVDAHRGSVNVTTTDSTTYLKTVDATVPDATPGSYVLIKGHPSSEDAASPVVARFIAIKPAPASPSPASTQGDSDKDGHGHRHGVAGTVLTNDGTTLTVQSADGSVVTVTADPDTDVTKTTASAFSELAVGQHVQVKGTRNDDGSFTARAVHIDLTTHERPEHTTATTAPTTTSTTVAPAVQSASLTSSEDTAPSTTARRAATKTTTTAAPRPAAADATHDDYTAGEITALGSNSFTIKLRDGSTKNVVTNDATRYMTRNADGSEAEGSFADLKVGDKVKVEGTQQPDGSILASEVVSGAGCDGFHGGSGDPATAGAGAQRGDFGGSSSSDGFRDGSRDGRSGRRH